MVDVVPPGEASTTSTWPTREAMEKRLSVSIPPSYWAFRPWGRKLLVRLLPPQTQIGMIYVPDNAQEQMGIGWVLKAGPQVGMWEAGIDVCPLSPDQLAGAQVIFSRWSGTPLMAHSKADDVEGEYLIIREGDIFGWLAPTPVVS